MPSVSPFQASPSPLRCGPQHISGHRLALFFRVSSQPGFLRPEAAASGRSFRTLLSGFPAGVATCTRTPGKGRRSPGSPGWTHPEWRWWQTAVTCGDGGRSAAGRVGGENKAPSCQSRKEATAPEQVSQVHLKRYRPGAPHCSGMVPHPRPLERALAAPFRL